MTISSMLPLVAQRLTGKVALITGAASGIGAATAKLFARHGAKVVVADIQDDLGHCIIQDINTSSGAASFIHCDVSDEGHVKAAVESAVSLYGKLDILFSNAGTSGGREAFGPIVDADLDIVRKTFEVNAMGAFHCAKHVARVMVEKKTRGSIIFNASTITKIVTRGVPQSYISSKVAVVGLTKGLAVELGQHGIRVNCVSPYGVATPMCLDQLRVGRREAEEVLEAGGNLKGVVLREEDVAEAALYLGSEEAKYVSGINLVIDGGYSRTNSSLRADS